MYLFREFEKFWNDKGLLVLFILSILFFIIYWFFSIFKGGNSKKYSSIYDYFSDNPIFITEKDNNDIKILKFNQTQNKKIVPKESKGESICRNYLQSRFKRPFNKARPSYMFNSVTGENLELDCFNEDMRLAVEYNGKQHYEYNKFMHRNSRDTFYNQVYRDRIKRDICKKLGIKLIEVPYTVPNDKIPDFLESKLREYGF
jgi:hypothetical protein